MYKVLIVDDEKVMRLNLKKIINWEKFGYKLLPEAKHGEHALEILSNCTADIVITDLKMPKIDGINLIKTLKSNNFLGKIVVLSNYDDFQLVRDALKLGASEYLLKASLDKEQLIATLQDIKNELLLDDQKREKEKKIVNDLDSVNKYRKNRFLQKLINSNDYTSTYISSKFKELNITLNQHKIIVYLVHIDNFDQLIKSNRINDKEKCMNSLLTIVEDSFNKNLVNEFLPIDQKDLVILSSTSGNMDLQPISLKIAQSVVDTVQMYMNISVSVVVSGVLDDLSTLSATVSKSLKSLAAKLYFGDGSVIYLSNHQFQSITGCDNELIRNRNEISRLFKENSFEKAAEKLKEFINLLKKNWVFPEQIVECVISILYEITNQLIPWGFSGKSIIEEYNQNLLRIENHEQFMQSITKIIQQLGRQYSELREKKYKKKILDIIDYINSNIEQKINLKMIADHVCLNESYLSRYFKAEYGQGLVSYINSIKMQKAKELLKKPDSYLMQIALDLGYEDQSYFNRVFKKYVGQNPGEYKKSFNDL